MTPNEAHDEAVRRIRAARARGETVLDLGYLPLEAIPHELSRANGLRVLSLGKMKPIDRQGFIGWEYDSERPSQPWPDLSPLAGLVSLFSLDLASCEAVADLSPLAGLTSLSSLNLDECEMVSDLSPLSGLVDLSRLDLRHCKGVGDLSPLSALVSLTSLDLGQCKAVADLSPLAGLTALSSLDLDGCDAVTDLSPLAGLASLRSLKLWGCKAVSDLRPLTGLTALSSLDLSGCKGVSDLSPLSGLAALSMLDLDWCDAVSDLSPLSGLPKLSSLHLSGCSRVSDLSPLTGLTSLAALKLWGCDWSTPLAILRPLLANLNRLILYQCSFPDLPAELAGEDHDENVLPAVRAYYADLDAGAVGDAESKVFLLGNGRVGKTQLARFLCERDYDPAEPSTHGVRLHDRPFDVPDLPHPVRLNLWDFGGQDIYHGSHALFLQGQAVFLLLWDPALETGEFTEAGLTIRNRSLAYWFDYLRTLAGSEGEDGRVVVESQVLLIQSRCESRRDERDPPYFPGRDEFPNLSTLSFSARTGRNRHSLTETLQEAIADLFGRRKQPLIGVGRVAVRERVRAAQAMPEGERIRTLTRDEFRAWCDEAGGVSDADALLQFLHRSGVVFHRPGLFGDRVILDQAWALEAIYAVFHRRTELQRELNLRRGRFTRELLDRFLWGAIRRDEGKEPYTAAEQELFLGMMTQCHIAFEVRDEAHGDAGREYAAPELLPEWSNWNDLHFRHLLRRPADYEVVLRYDFLHDGIARRFLAEVGGRARQQAVYWKYGCGFYDAATETDAIVRCEPAPTAERPGAGAISLRAWGPGARELLRTLTEVLMRMPIGQPPRLEPADFLDRAERRGMRSDAGNPMERVVPAVRPRTVFVSYAHGPVTSDLVRRLAARLGSAGTTVVWDEECLREGESISAFIDSVRTVPVLLAVFDARYPRSPYCVSELFAFYEACGSRPAVFAERVVPLVLDDARIDGDLERAEHAAFWAEEYERRRAAAGAGHLDVSRYVTFQHMQTWRGQIANVLAAVADRLSSLRGGGIAANDFRNVVDRLAAVSRRPGM